MSAEAGEGSLGALRTRSPQDGGVIVTCQ